MCQSISELRDAIASYAQGFDPSLMSCASAASVVSDAAAIESITAALKTLAAARATESGRWREAGYRSPGEGLARQTGITPSAAKDILQTGERLASQPEVASAALDGRLSASQAALIANAVEADPSSAGRLIDLAGQACWASSRTKWPVPKPR